MEGKRKIKKKPIMSSIFLAIALFSLIILLRVDVNIRKETTLQEDKLSEEFHLREKDDRSYFNYRTKDLKTYGVLYIPKINLRLLVYETKADTIEQVLENMENAENYGAAHWYSLDDIDAGKGTRALLSSHNGLSIGELFTHINKLDFGDKFYIKKEDGEILAYRVYEKTTTTPSAEITERHTEEGYYTDKDNALYTNPEEEILTLQTCTPIYFNTHRLLVNALRIPYEQEEIKVEKDNKLFYAYYLLVALFILNLFRLIFNIVNNIKYNKVKQYLEKTKGEKK